MGSPEDFIGPAPFTTFPGAPSPSNPYPPAVDYSPVMAYMSDNNKTIALAQIQAQEFAMQQASMDRQMQLAVNLELGMEGLDTKLQMAKLQFQQEMTAEQNSNQEKLAEIHVKQADLERGHGAASPDLPPPDMDFLAG